MKKSFDLRFLFPDMKVTQKQYLKRSEKFTELTEAPIDIIQNIDRMASST